MDNTTSDSDTSFHVKLVSLRPDNFANSAGAKVDGISVGFPSFCGKIVFRWRLDKDALTENNFER